VSDANLASFRINDTPVPLTPGLQPGEYRFDLALQPTPGVASPRTLNARGYRLVEVSRSHEPVPGQLSLLPGERVAAFYPRRELAYDAEVLLDIDKVLRESSGKW